MRPHLNFWSNPDLPVLLQTEAAECGVACLAMVASYWGRRTDLASMRRRFSVSMKGTTLKALIGMARQLALRGRPLRLEFDQLGGLRLPCILHWDLNHFVVLASVSERHVVIHDPAAGARRLAWTEVSRHFTGVAMELSPEQDFKRTRETERFSLFSLMGPVRGLKRSLAQLLMLGVTLQVFSLMVPFYLQWVVDEALMAGDRSLLAALGIGFLLLVAMQAALEAVRSWVMTTLSTNLNFEWFGRAFLHLLNLPMSYFEKRHLGDVLSRFASIQAIQHALTTQFAEGVLDGLLAVSTLVLMCIYSGNLASVALIALATYALVRCAMLRSLREASTEQIVHAAHQQSHLLQSARGVQSLRLFNRIDERHAGWMDTLADQFNADLRVAKMSISFRSATTLIFGAERILVIWLAASAVLDASFTVGMLFAFIGYKDQFTQRMVALVDRLFEFRMLGLHGERVADILLTKPEDPGPQGENELADLEPSIELRDLSFRYSDSEPYIVRKLNLTIPTGQSIAFAGASGSGKTTLVKLMLGLLEPTEGEILIGGVPLRQVGVANYRRQVGVVMQDDHMFSGTIAENICFFDSRPDVDRIEDSAREAAIHKEIADMPMGYNTLIGDSGSGLSGGQRQRILLARALYKKPRILVLDEATSHLDTANEHLVNLAIRQYPLTRIIVAHRPETLAMAERQVILEHGRIARDLHQLHNDGEGGRLGPRCSAA